MDGLPIAVIRVEVGVEAHEEKPLYETADQDTIVFVLSIVRRMDMGPIPTECNSMTATGLLNRHYSSVSRFRYAASRPRACPRWLTKFFE